MQELTCEQTDEYNQKKEVGEDVSSVVRVQIARAY